MLHITEQESSYFNQRTFPIHDFSGYNIYSTETVPRTPGITMHWYSDSSHYRQALGRVILNTIMTGHNEGSFGRVINAQNINTHLQSIKADHLQYVLHHAQDISDIQQLVIQRKRDLY